MDTIKTIILGIVQGLTEFLPVSSSGHLIIAQTLMDIGESGMLLEVVLHVATGIAVLFVFRKDILSLVRGWFSSDIAVRRDSFTYSGYIILATLPAAVVGVFFKKYIDVLYDTGAGNRAAYIASCMLFVTAGLLFYSSMKGGRRSAVSSDATTGPAFCGGGLTVMNALLIGLIQAVAIMPGISRSGSTIAMALILGVSREEAGRFSFMLSLPAIFGAALLEARGVESFGALMSVDMIAGFIAAMAVGVVALKLLLSFVKKGKLHYFGYYCVGAAVISIVCLSFIGT